MLNGPLSQDHITERVRKLFGKAPLRLQVAALPWRQNDGTLEVMLITSRDTGRWVLPKGWPEAREPLCEAGRYFYAKALSTGQQVPCEVLVFPLLVDTIADKWKECHQRERKWVTPAQATRMVNEPDLGQIIAYFGTDPQRFAA
jgi:hypothetical protein